MRLLIALILLGASSLALAAGDDCENAVSTMDINLCKAKEVEKAEGQMDKYLQASIKRHKDDQSTVRLINDTQDVWEKYRTKHCDTVFHIWADGTIRGVMRGECKLRLTKARTHELWQSFLTYGDDTPPDLPEPK
ncbi:DUF1311 domain-containing protein [Marinobacter halodurans]|uniref:DUF1311 domain-containing protein n=1 Tax=Marinobacter halodurans TaxID=2528979 RepID=A0ABY1ZNA8_9GAMM|nr:lysozyme inhibitor LprI family protein [Marinobacter halodurans]TBW57978.1 DUF1311 domain-containing protein [Marinobacter halodurans]